MNDIVRMEHRAGTTFWIQFDNGVAGEVDLSPYLNGPIFQPLREPEYIRKAALDGGTLAWPNGADVAPETLYEALEEPVSRVAEDAPDYKTRNG